MLDYFAIALCKLQIVPNISMLGYAPLQRHLLYAGKPVHRSGSPTYGKLVELASEMFL
ncbi:MAG: hypothetical protein QNJ63_03095 [Calothrix sp. MO_192.B10]|nr:hypothetical protein [Calothrix sp. MO_192.B10]